MTLKDAEKVVREIVAVLRQLLLGFATIRTNAQTLANVQRSHLSIIDANPICN
ncbi:hypothetical protein H6F89_33075 [Cyanobacteria bacterium FACHB-63]|nr:hypothetical protein [Cyanobacteria bacterium FACHB-63]